jgi:predicted sulfurtransferase
MSDRESKAARKAEKKRKRAAAAEAGNGAEEQGVAAASASPATAASSHSAAAAASSADGEEEEEEEEEEERAAKKARKDAKRAKRERDAEVMQAGARALQEEKDEDDAAAATAAVASAANEAEVDKAERKRRKRERREAEAAAAAAAAAPAEEGEESEEARRERKRAKKEKKEKEKAAAAAASSSTVAAAASVSSSAPEGGNDAGAKVYPPFPAERLNVTLLLFYQYVRPSWSAAQRQNAENFTRDSLTRHGCTGRLRCAKEGFNGTLTGSAAGIRAFCQDLREYEPQHFGNTDFKLVDGLRDTQKLKGLKVWHVDELVTYGFGKSDGVLEKGGTHLSPQDWHDGAAEEGAVLIDVRNANENAIGRFQPLNDPHRVLDPNMRVSTEFPEWVDSNMSKLQNAKKVMMYCTGGIRCERASALLVEKGVPAEKVFQLEGGIHRYLEAFPDGGHWSVNDRSALALGTLDASGHPTFLLLILCR